MSRSAQSAGTIRGVFTVYDASNNPVSGLVQGDFTRLVAKDGVDSAVLPTIAEISQGRYTYTIPLTAGYWHVLIRNAANNPRGYTEEFDVS